MAEAVNVHEEEKELLEANQVSRKLRCLIMCQQRCIHTLRATEASQAGEAGRAWEVTQPVRPAGLRWPAWPGRLTGQAGQLHSDKNKVE